MSMFLKQSPDKFLILFFCLTTLLGCKSINQTNCLQEEIMENIIKNYCKKNVTYTLKYKYFRLSKDYIDSTDFIMYRVSPQINKVVLSSDGSGYFPLDYIKVGKKIFFIDGEITTKPSPKIFTLLKEKDLIDSTMVKVKQGLLDWDVIGKGKGTIMTNDRLKVNTYLVCKTNNKIVSKWRTNKSEVSAKNIKKAIKKGCKN